MSSDVQTTIIDVNALSKGDLRAIAARELNRRAKVRQARLGSRHTPEARKAISEGNRRAWAAKKAAQKHALDSNQDTVGNEIAQDGSVHVSAETDQRGMA